MKWLQLIGRILFGLLFVSSGLGGHFASLGFMAQYAGSKGVPMPEVLVIITGAMITLGGLSVILGYRPKIGLWLLVAFLVPVAFIMHGFWGVGPEQMAMEQTQFFKDLALAGAALVMIVSATDEPWPLSLGSWAAKMGRAIPGQQAGETGVDVQGGGTATSPLDT